MNEVPTLYFLDSSSIGTIKKELAGQRQNVPQHRDHVKELHALDCMQHGVSAFLGLLEKTSDQRMARSAQEMTEEGHRDRLAMEGFFKHATVMETEQTIDEGLHDILGVHLEVLGREYLSLLLFSRRLGLHQPVKASSRMKVAQAVVDEAVRLGVPAAHPIVVAVVATIYDCLSARRVIKFAKDEADFNAGNALGDIQALQRAQSIFSTLKAARPVRYQQARLITGDKNLGVFGSVLNLQCVASSISDDGMAHELTLHPDVPRLLPGLFDANGQVREGKQDELAMVQTLLRLPKGAWWGDGLSPVSVE